MDKKKISSFVETIVEEQLPEKLKEERERLKDHILKEVLERVSSVLNEFSSHQGQLEQYISDLKRRVKRLEKKVKRLQKDVEVDTEQGEEKEPDETQELGGTTTRDREESGSSRSPEPALNYIKNEFEKKDSDRTDKSTQTSRNQETEDPSLGSTTAESSTAEPSSDKQLVDDFNRFLYGDLSKRDFEEQYDPIRLGIENEEERLDKAQAPVLLRKDERGRYLAVERNTYYLVLPDYNLILDESVRRQAGFDEVFQCGEASHQHPYRVKRVDKAARFVYERQEQFGLDTPGAVALVRYG